MKIKIDRSIPLPPNRRGAYGQYPFSKMKVGDSFFTKNPRGNVTGSADVYGKRHNMKFASRKTRNGCRVWRIK